MDIQEQIAELKTNGWTLASIADALGASWQTASRWENGTIPPKMPRCVSLALSMLLTMPIPPLRREGSRDTE